MMTLDLAPTAEAVPMARSALDALRRSVSEQSLEDARLMVSELVANSVRHGDLGEEDTIRVSADSAAGVLRVEVRDPGRGFVPRQRTSSSAEHAQWGLYLVAHLADRWGVDADDGATLVWFEIASDRPSA